MKEVTPDLHLSENLLLVLQKIQALMTEYAQQKTDHWQVDPIEWLHLRESFQQAMQKILLNPEHWLQVQTELFEQYLQLWRNTQGVLQGEIPPPDAAPDKKDKRFVHPSWQAQPLFAFVRDAYLLTVNTMNTLLDKTEGKLAEEAKFYARQVLDAASPSNFVATNPELLELTLNSQGDNLIKGLDNWRADVKRYQGAPYISMTDLNAFRIGDNIATTPGQVIYQNRLIQLIQYASVTEKVYQKPLLIVPPWINKYYILDLSEKNSFVKWIVEQGYTVFMISWVNPDEQHAAVDFEDYMLEGVLAALTEVVAISGCDTINTLGFCIGGTLLAATLGYLAAKKDKRIASATYLATLLDFSMPGELGIFISEEKIAVIEARMAKTGYLHGRDLAIIFNLLRENDLIWPYYINNYLKGKMPSAFDLLYWNSDSTHLPAKMHSFYLRNMYLNNQLCQPNGIRLANTPISLQKIKTPSYFIATKEDHIAPWQTVYQGMQLLTGPKRFVLGAAGHIAGIINSPRVNKYNHWVNENFSQTADSWLQQAQPITGSWWLDWEKWLQALSGEQIHARTLEKEGIEPAPGSYVRRQL